MFNNFPNGADNCIFGDMIDSQNGFIYPTQEDINNYGFDSNNGPPLIKIYWKEGYIWCHKKSLKDTSISGEDLIQPYTSSNNFWTDDKKNLGFVGYDTFDFSITASAAKIEVQLNNNNPVL